MIQLSNDLNKGNTTASQVIKEELPFDVYAYEKEYGPIRTQEELCPGIYQIRNGPVPPWHFCTEYIVVLKNSPAISDEPLYSSAASDVYKRQKRRATEHRQRKFLKS